MTNRTDSTTAATGTRTETGSEAAATSEDAYSDSGSSPPRRDECPTPLSAKREEALERTAAKLAHPAPNHIRLFEIAETKMPGNDAGQMHEGDAFCDGGSSPPRTGELSAPSCAEHDGSVEPIGDYTDAAPANALATSAPAPAFPAQSPTLCLECVGGHFKAAKLANVTRLAALTGLKRTKGRSVTITHAYARAVRPEVRASAAGPTPRCTKRKTRSLVTTGSARAGGPRVDGPCIGGWATCALNRAVALTPERDEIPNRKRGETP